MKDIIINLYSAGGVEDYYIPVSCRGTIKSAKVSANATLVAAGTITLLRGASIVNLLTAPTGDVAAGVALDGVPDATNKGLIFDPDDDTVANTKIKVSFDTSVLGGVANVLLQIVFDDSAYVAEVDSEA